MTTRRNGPTAEEWAQSPEAVLTAIGDDRHEGRVEDELMKAFDKLPANQAEVMSLRVFGGYSQETVAGMLGITRKAVRTMEEAARATMVGALAESGAL